MYFQLSQFLTKQKRAPQVHPEAPENLTRAAVLALLIRDGGEDHLLFTKRSQTVLHHKGQICFPGGACDAGDKDLWGTALRETREEIGLDPQAVSFVGELGQIVTPSGYKVTPFVGSLAGLAVWRPNPHEIEEVFMAPVRHFLHPENFRMVKKSCRGFEYEDPLFLYQHYEVWGATGRILVELMEAWRGVRQDCIQPPICQKG